MHKPTENYRDPKIITLNINGSNVKYKVFWNDIEEKWQGAPNSSGVVSGTSDKVVGAYIMG